jgi:hypothetical protein
LNVHDQIRKNLVASDDELLDSQGLSQQSMLPSLSVLRDAGFELTSATGHHQDGTIGLGRSYEVCQLSYALQSYKYTSDHVLDEIAMTRSVDDGDVILGGLELPQSDVDGDTAFTLGFQLVQDL